jgi:type I restriction enzyme R subunit
MKFTEARLEAAIIELLGAEGFPHGFGEAIERQPQEVLIKAGLRAFLAYQECPPGCDRAHQYAALPRNRHPVSL